MASPQVFRLLAHELRSPASVIGGYARMLREGRLDEPARQQALAQIERAAIRISHISRQASDLARWLAPEQRPPAQAMPVRVLVTRAVAGSGSPAVPIAVTPEAESMAVHVLDDDSLAEAVASVVDAVARETLDQPVHVIVRAVGPPAACEILVAPVSQLQAPEFPAARGEEQPFAFDRGGQGLSLIVAAAVFSAHNSQIWAAGDPPGAVGIRLLAAQDR